MNRTAKIKYRNKISQPIQLRSGVPQGGILSPTLFIVYTSDMPPAGPNTTDILFADDVSQLVEYHHASKRMLATRTSREIQRINDYEKKWKIKTSEYKFKILSISAQKPYDVLIDNRKINFANEISILGLKITRTGINAHIKERIRKAFNELKKLKRFKLLTPKVKTHLYKALIRPIYEYPIMPMCNIAASNQLKLQRIQNSAIKFIKSNDNEQLTIEEAHKKYNIEAVNVRLFKRAQKMWDRFTIAESELVERSMAENEQIDTKDHYWWKRLASGIDNQEPNPIYT